MRKIIFTGLAAAALVTAVPALAQVDVGVPGVGGVHIGGYDHDRYYDHDRDYYRRGFFRDRAECGDVIIRHRLPDGTVVIRHEHRC